jgi:hypothetical protein
LASALQQLGFEACTSDQCVYINKKTRILIVTYVDDMLIIGKDIAKVKILKKKLIKIFDIEDLGPAKYFVRVRITRDRKKDTITLCQDAYINKILERYGMEMSLSRYTNGFRSYRNYDTIRRTSYERRYQALQIENRLSDVPGSSD